MAECIWERRHSRPTPHPCRIMGGRNVKRRVHRPFIRCALFFIPVQSAGYFDPFPPFFSAVTSVKYTLYRVFLAVFHGRENYVSCSDSPCLRKNRLARLISTATLIVSSHGPSYHVTVDTGYGRSLIYFFCTEAYMIWCTRHFNSRCETIFWRNKNGMHLIDAVYQVFHQGKRTFIYLLRTVSVQYEDMPQSLRTPFVPQSLYTLKIDTSRKQTDQTRLTPAYP